MGIIDEIKIFYDLGENEKETVNRLLQVRDFKPGEVIYGEGESGESALDIIVKGKVKINRVTIEGEQLQMATLRAGEKFGIMSFLDGSRHNASVVAEEETRLLILKKSDFDNLIQTNPVIGVKILRNIAVGLAKLVKDLNAQHMDLMHMMFRKSK
ncbi:MAG: hypothetical protein CVV37_02240 [Nitrospira bacterium HGW-Nitrospira-1]|nr:MAG: hypothetical protein CVV37_02240 [Nitrospira bacterium HGW-Nitrospira-1]